MDLDLKSNQQQNWGVNPQLEPIKKPGFYQRHKKGINIIAGIFAVGLFILLMIHLFSKDGQLSDWSAWSTCDKTCGDGTQFRTRTYIPPVYLGSDLQDKDKLKETQKCNQGPCITSPNAPSPTPSVSVPRNWAGFEYSTDGRCGPIFGNNKACTNGSCCSVGGWCGTSDAHCAQVYTSAAGGSGSYSDGIYNDTRPSYLLSLINSTSRNWNNQQYSTTTSSNGQIRCGPNIGACPYSLCCSKLGYCGHTLQFCAQQGTSDAGNHGSHTNGIYNDTRPSYNV